MKGATRAAVVAIALLAWGCQQEGPPNPAPRPEGEETASSSSGGHEAEPPGPRIRTVETRNPLGRHAGNLLVDGDFEGSVTFEGAGAQVGWFAFSSVGQRYLRIETGGLCRSGLRCGVLPSDTFLFGRGTSAADTGMVASVWVQPPEGDGCESVQPSVIRCSFSSNVAAPLPPREPVPDDDGWCFYRGKVEAQPEPACFYVQAESFEGEGPAIVDDARLLPDDGTAPLAKEGPVAPGRAAVLREGIERLRERMPIGSPSRAEPPVGRR